MTPLTCKSRHVFLGLRPDVTTDVTERRGAMTRNAKSQKHVAVAADVVRPNPAHADAATPGFGHRRRRQLLDAPRQTAVNQTLDSERAMSRRSGAWSLKRSLLG